MTDKKFLFWIHERLIYVHKEPQMVDYLHHLRHIIADMDAEKETPNVARCDTDPELMRKQFSYP